MKNLKKKKPKDFFTFAKSIMSEQEIKEAYFKADKIIFTILLKNSTQPTSPS